MKRCIRCNEIFGSQSWRCPACAAEPAVLDGFLAFAADAATDRSGYEPNSHAVLDQMRKGSFWFRARSRLIIDLTCRYFPGAQHVMEVGCGTGNVLLALRSALPGSRLCGSDIHVEALALARRRVADSVELAQMDARNIPFEAEFDLIRAFDVLEHFDDDESAIAQMFRALRPGGGVLLSVPQHPFMRSRIDARAKHKRRYRRNELGRKCARAGFDIVRSTSFVTTLLPVMAMQRLGPGQRKDYEIARELRLHPRLDRLAEAVLDFERACIAGGLSFPVG
ncbi:MAG TPA: class I SAM-dependent methyltransferase, partial [Candidatus Cybelea sp.]|nr:class I SAM-dependent methyltransferase [Candidatus Cybelea sp.]